MNVKEYFRLLQSSEFGLTCDDGTDLTNYSGTLSVTDGSRTCQRWSEQTPHKHVFNTDDMFPLDGSVENAVNYCRNIGGDEHPWCLTIDPKVRWQYCYEQICKGIYPVLCFLYNMLNNTCAYLKKKIDLYVHPASILYKSIAGRYRPVSYPDGPITARYRFIKNASWAPIFIAYSPAGT